MFIGTTEGVDDIRRSLVIPAMGTGVFCEEETLAEA